jgi:hypothetical protein
MCRGGGSLLYAGTWDDDRPLDRDALTDAVRQFVECLRPGGRLYVDTPARRTSRVLTRSGSTTPSSPSVSTSWSWRRSSRPIANTVSVCPRAASPRGKLHSVHRKAPVAMIGTHPPGVGAAEGARHCGRPRPRRATWRLGTRSGGQGLIGDHGQNPPPLHPHHSPLHQTRPRRRHPSHRTPRPTTPPKLINPNRLPGFSRSRGPPTVDTRCGAPSIEVSEQSG